MINIDELREAFRHDIMGGLNWDRILREAKPVDAVPVVHGRWIQVSQDRANCNRCNCESGKMIKQGERYFPKFCPECGADMRKDGEAHGTK